MERSWVLKVFSVNAGKVINTRREVVKVVSLMLFGVRFERPQVAAPHILVPAPRAASLCAQLII